MTAFKTSITRDGPFFRYDPAKTFRQNVRTMMDDLAAEGEADVRGQLRVGEASRLPISRLGDRVADHVVGRTHSLVGKRWAVTANISVNNTGYGPAEGIALMAAASRVESRTHAFRKTRGRISRSRKVNAAELIKGIA